MPAPFFDIVQSSQYLNGANDNTFDLVEGTFALPVAQTPPTNAAELAAWSPVSIVRAHSAYRIRRLQFSYLKSNTPPAIPSPESGGAFNFLQGSVAFSTRPNLSFCSYDWSVVGNYTFVENCRSSPVDGFVLGTGPYPTITQQDNIANLSPTVSSGIDGLPIQGAISQAGADAKVGFNQGRLITNSGIGWLYNTVSYFPPTLLNSQLVNGNSGLPAVGLISAPNITQAVTSGQLFQQTQEPIPDTNEIPDPFGNESPF